MPQWWSGPLPDRALPTYALPERALPRYGAATSYTEPATLTTGTLITAAMWNAYITNNVTWFGGYHDHSGDSGDGVTLTAAPSGIILMFDADCPDGWTRVSAFDGKFLRGASSYGGTGGGSHSHTVDGHTHTPGYGQYHTHQLEYGAVGSGSGGTGITDLDAGYPTTSEATGSAGPDTDAVTTPPVYVDVVFCKKD